MSGISTHILDVSLGKPAAGVQVLLERFGNPGAAGLGVDGNLWKTIADLATDDDGRCRPVLAAEKVTAGIYRLTFVTGPYYKALGTATLYPEVTITFTVSEPNYHIPLLLSPFGYSTYRGS